MLEPCWSLFRKKTKNFRRILATFCIGAGLALPPTTYLFAGSTSWCAGSEDAGASVRYKDRGLLAKVPAHWHTYFHVRCLALRRPCRRASSSTVVPSAPITILRGKGSMRIPSQMCLPVHYNGGLGDAHTSLHGRVRNVSVACLRTDDGIPCRGSALGGFGQCCGTLPG